MLGSCFTSKDFHILLIEHVFFLMIKTVLRISEYGGVLATMKRG